MAADALCRLVTADRLLRLEADICARLAAFFSFASHALYFSEAGPDAPELLEEEKRLLLPLAQIGAMRAVLRFEGVAPEECLALLAPLPKIARLCLEAALLELDCDADTGLLSERALLKEAQEAIACIRGAIQSANLALITFRWAEPPAPWGASGRRALEDAWRSLAAVAVKAAPAGASTARLGRLAGEFEFGILARCPSRAACQRVALSMLGALEAELDKSCADLAPRRPRLSAGHALYPQDFSGEDALRTDEQQAILLRDRARLAARKAWDADHIKQPALAWGWLPSLAGEIASELAHGRLLLNIGASAGIKPGQSFYIVARGRPRTPANAKALATITAIGRRRAVAEASLLRPGEDPPRRGDAAVLRHAQARSRGAAPASILDQAEFLEKLKRSSAGEFMLAITRFSAQREAGAIGPLAATLAARELGSLADGFAGLHGNEGIITYRHGASESEAAAFFRRLHERARSAGLDAATGIFFYPCLNYGKSESESCALKALDYALLLPEPRIGVFGAVALAISADKRFSFGDELGALEEYQLALLLKPNDAGLLNSLGVCLAALSRGEQARAKFQEALDLCADAEFEAKIAYNLGSLYQKNNDLPAARDCYRRCLRRDPSHIYAWTRMGQIYERAGKPGASRKFYERAAGLAQTDADLLNMIQRQLARLESGGKQIERAREILHDSLLRNPRDGASLLLLAQTYLEDDPAMAETLARRCLRLGFDASSALADALAAQGHREEAEAAKRSGYGRQ